MTGRGWLDVDVGTALVLRLLPQRPPLLLVDRVAAWQPGDRPALRTQRFLSANDPVFHGHFPDLPLLPGALLVEAAGQTASLLYTLEQIARAHPDGVAGVIAELRALDRALTLRPGDAPQGGVVAGTFGRLSGLPVGVAGEVRMKFLRPVFPGCRLDVEARLTHRMGEQLHLEVHAEVGGEPVARGSLAAALVEAWRPA